MGRQSLLRQLEKSISLAQLETHVPRVARVFFSHTSRLLPTISNFVYGDIKACVKSIVLRESLAGS